MTLFQKSILLAVALSLLYMPVVGQKAVKLKSIKSVMINIPEPSDIAYSESSNTYFIVSDEGILCETDNEGKEIRRAIEKNADFEGVFTNGQNVYALDESHRNIYIYDQQTFNLKQVVNVQYSGGRNKGFESICFNKIRGTIIIVTEKEPIYLFELDEQLKVANRVNLTGIARDISAATWYNNHLWLLSDEDMLLIKVDPANYKVLSKWKLPVINPEGMTFDKDGNLLILCDDMQRLYSFPNPEQP